MPVNDTYTLDTTPILSIRQMNRVPHNDTGHKVFVHPEQEVKQRKQHDPRGNTW
jgi:hypothetical protein